LENKKYFQIFRLHKINKLCFHLGRTFSQLVVHIQLDSGGDLLRPENGNQNSIQSVKQTT
jgi:hypothetical protein